MFWNFLDDNLLSNCIKVAKYMVWNCSVMFQNANIYLEASSYNLKVNVFHILALGSFGDTAQTVPSSDMQILKIITFFLTPQLSQIFQPVSRCLLIFLSRRGCSVLISFARPFKEQYIYMLKLYCIHVYRCVHDRLCMPHGSSL